MKRSLAILFVLSTIVSHISASGIKFEKAVNFDNLLARSALENKPIFLDFYADWCIPCKSLDKIFLENNVAEHFNKDFINYKIDIESVIGKTLSKKLNVVFLPSMIIINQHGDILLKIENLIPGNELIKNSKEALRNQVNRNTYVLNDTPFPSQKNHSDDADYDPNEKEKVLYILDQRASSGRPHIMFHEAYLHLQLMDGKHDDVVRKYLSTQEDWSTEKNIKFIFDFLNDVNSPRFEYFLKNKSRFIEVIGEEKVALALEILVHQRLDRGFPRPNLDEAIRLFGYLEDKQSKDLGYEYFLTRLLNENRIAEYLQHASDYLEGVNPYNIKVILNYVTHGLTEENSNESIDHYIKYLEVAQMIDDQNYLIHLKMAELFYLKKNALQAMHHIDKAIDLNADVANSEFIIRLKKKINAL